MIHRAHKIRLNPTPEQEAYFWQCAGVSRFTWNWALAEYNKLLEAGQKPNLNALKVEFNRLRREEGFAPWVGEVHCWAYQYAFTDLQTAFARYFDRRKTGTLPKKGKPRKDHKPLGWPRFKSRHDTVPAFGLANSGAIKCQEHNAIISRCPGPVNMAETLRFEGKVMSGRVSYQGNHWYLSIALELADPTPKPVTGRVSVDLGIKSLAVTSDAVVYPNPKRLQKSQRKLARVQRELARRTKDGKNYLKSKAKLNKLHQKIANQRREALHEMTTDLTSTYEVVVVEDLNVAGMLQNHHLARAVSDVAFGEIRRQLEYKAPAFGSQVIVADRWYPSSKTCHSCGQTLDLTLADRVWACPNCGTTHDRDLNAALNLRDYQVPQVQAQILVSKE